MARNLQYVSYNASTDAHQFEVTLENIDEYIDKIRRIEQHENEIKREIQKIKEEDNALINEIESSLMSIELSIAYGYKAEAKQEALKAISLIEKIKQENKKRLQARKLITVCGSLLNTPID